MPARSASGVDLREGLAQRLGDDLLEEVALGLVAPGLAALAEVLDASSEAVSRRVPAGRSRRGGDVDVGRGRRAERLGDRVVQLAQAVEHLLVLVGQLLERPLVVLEPVLPGRCR